MIWQQIAAISAAFYTVLFLVALIVAWWQLHEMSKARKLESVLHILEYVDNQDLRRVRWFIYENADSVRKLFGVAESGPHSWELRKQMDREIRRLSSLDGGKEIDIHQFDLVLSALNNVAFLVREGYAPFSAIRMMRSSFLRCADILGPYIELRSQWGLDDLNLPSKYTRFEWAVEKIRQQDARTAR